MVKEEALEIRKIVFVLATISFFLFQLKGITPTDVLFVVGASLVFLFLTGSVVANKLKVVEKRINVYLFLFGIALLFFGIVSFSDYEAFYVGILRPFQVLGMFESTTAFKAEALIILVGASFFINSIWREKRKESKNIGLILAALVLISLIISFVYAPFKLDQIIGRFETDYIGIDGGERPGLKYDCQDLIFLVGNRTFYSTIPPISRMSHGHNHLLRLAGISLSGLNIPGVENFFFPYSNANFFSTLDLLIIAMVFALLCFFFMIETSLQTRGTTAQRLYKLLLFSFITYLLLTMIFEAEEVSFLPLLAVFVGLFFFEEFGVFRRFGIDREVYLTLFFAAFWAASLISLNKDPNSYLLGAMFLYALWGANRLAEREWIKSDKLAILTLLLGTMALIVFRQYVLMKFVMLFLFLLPGISSLLKKRATSIIFLIFAFFYVLTVISTAPEQNPEILNSEDYRSFQTFSYKNTLVFLDKQPDVAGYEIFRRGNAVIVASNDSCEDCVRFANKFERDASLPQSYLIVKDTGADFSACGIENAKKKAGWVEIPLDNIKVKDFPFGCVLAEQAKHAGRDEWMIHCYDRR